VPSLAEKKQELDATIRGFLLPIFEEYAPNGGRLSLLSEEDFHKVSAGYACSECLAEFVTYMVRCPVCGHERDLLADVGHTPEMWVDHLKERAAIESGEKRAPRVVPRGIDDLVRDLQADPDVENIRL